MCVCLCVCLCWKCFFMWAATINHRKILSVIIRLGELIMGSHVRTEPKEPNISIVDMKAKGWRGMGEITICRLARVWGDPWSIVAAAIHPPFTVACHPSRGQRRRRFSEGSFMSASSHQRAAERHAGRARGKHTQAQTHWSYRHVSVHPAGYSVMLYWQLRRLAHTRTHTHCRGCSLDQIVQSSFSLSPNSERLSGLIQQARSTSWLYHPLYNYRGKYQVVLS